MKATMRVEVSSPGWTKTFEDVMRVRLEVLDGSRGVLPGHEPARAQLVPGAVELTLLDGTSRFLATEGGIAWIDRTRLVLATSWASVDDDLDSLAEAVRRRGQLRKDAEREARAIAHRHEKAAQRALVALRRGGSA